jgi:hypothetical protein
MLPSAALHPDVRFESRQLVNELIGEREYRDAASRWLTDAQDVLPNFRTELLRCELSPSDDATVIVRWRAAWEPESSAWLAALGSSVGWKVERVSLLPRSDEVVTFSWRRVGALLGRAVTTGRLTLPVACVEARATLRFEKASGRLVRHTEAIDQLADAAAGRLKNRIVAQDAAAFCDVCRRPGTVDPDEWAAQVRAAALAGVPGTGALDIVPSEDGGEEGAIALATFALVAAAAVGVFANAIGGESTGMVFGEDANSVICDEMMASIASTRSQDYSQCVSDLFGP